MLKDIVGKELNPGDMIAYPGRSGSNIWMTTAKSLEIKEEFNCYGTDPIYSIKARKENGFVVMVDRVDNVVKIEGIQDDRYD